jgi:hypothetical protein
MSVVLDVNGLSIRMAHSLRKTPTCEGLGGRLPSCRDSCSTRYLQPETELQDSNSPPARRAAAGSQCTHCLGYRASARPPAASRRALLLASYSPRSQSGARRRVRVFGFPQNSPIRSARSKSGSIKTWSSSARGAGPRASRRSRSRRSSWSGLIRPGPPHPARGLPCGEWRPGWFR